MFLKFGKDDVFHNILKTYPEYTFFIYDSKVYHNNNKPGLTDVSLGEISIYEINVNRTSAKDADNNEIGMAYPFITKEGARTAFKTVSAGDFNDSSQFQWGDTLKGSYPLTSSISRIYIYYGDNLNSFTHDDYRTDDTIAAFTKPDYNKKYINALEVTLNESKRFSEHYAFTSTGPFGNWDKGKQSINMICVPSIYYGSSIKRGSVKLNMYMKGELFASLQDTKKNGELIQISGSNGEGSVAGVVLYEHGIFLLTGSWDIETGGIYDDTNWHSNINADNDLAVFHPKWLYFGAKMPLVGEQRAHAGLLEGHNASGSFEVNFKGINYIPTITMMAHADVAELNYSNNPTFVDYDTRISAKISKTKYEETQPYAKNTIKSNFKNDDAVFEKQVFISKIGIYDKNKNLIAIANLANPVQKKESQEYTFKLKLDF